MGSDSEDSFPSCVSEDGVLDPGSSDSVIVDNKNADNSTFTISIENLPSNETTTSVGTSGTNPTETIRPLPPFHLMSAPSFAWGEMDGESFFHSITCCYDEVIHWKKSLFRLPSGKSGRAFVSELCRLFRAYASGSALECVAMKAIMVMPVLLLQRPHHWSRNDDNIVHLSHLSRRMDLW